CGSLSSSRWHAGSSPGCTCEAKMLVLMTVVACVLPPSPTAQEAKAQTATGHVFEDTNKNRKLDAGETGLAGVRVSNGKQITKTDRNGRYELPVDDDTVIFVIKPRGYRSPLSKNMLPRFYYVHKPNGSPKLNFPGVKPTGPLPASVDFPMYAQEEPKQFEAIMFGDPQPRNQKEVDWIGHDIIEDLVGTEASFGVTLGDIAFDNLKTMQPLNRTIGLLGIPWYNVIGNHDINYDVKERKLANETFERIYGPSYYSFDHGPVHFIVVDNIEWRFDDDRNKMAYRGGIGSDQMQFIKNDLALVPDNQLVVLMMHIPLTNTHDRKGLYKLIQDRKFCMSISGHTHYHEHVFISKKDGWEGLQPHHHVINVTVCGSWWGGQADERGIPHTTMSDGAPNGYSTISFDGSDYYVNFRAAGRAASYQMELHAPELVKSSESGKKSCFANVFNGSEKTDVEMRVAGGEWQAMKKVREVDPKRQSVFDREAAILKTQPDAFRKLNAPRKSGHLWRVNLPAELPEGTHLIEVRAKLTGNRVFHGKRIIRVTSD
ncbi:MAG: calcineurin-like phosphoesterase C-terminal domain-containing protein, partial [Planctomycetaceae bacterium]